ncbi:hypothetical protein [Pedobacter sp. GR22-6]|uniref:hypothetical protein n=1 Tax=Pedobacter sp. GR22-6 TaxID=3127957 RepID=UPI00307F248B
MKVTEKPSSFILLKARTASEWDNCEFAIVKIDQQWLNTAKERLESVKSFKGNQSFYCHVYWDAPIGYFTDLDEIICAQLQGSEFDFLYVELEENEVETMQTPESKLDTHMLKITQEGQCSFKAYGKHTGEEFWTESFPLIKVVNS